MTNLFKAGRFFLHSGGLSDFKIDCDALTEQDLETIASIIYRNVKSFGWVYGIPTGATKLALVLNQYCVPGQRRVLIVDDVYTTGNSMETERSKFKDIDVIGAVIFARNKCPDWIRPVFKMEMK